MNRKLTNFIRFVMDDLTPPVIRDSKWFMYPFFYIWYKGKNLKKHMEFKTNVYNYTDEEYADFYKNYDSLARDRITDLSEACIKKMLVHLKGKGETLLDIGCGNGYWLSRVEKIDYKVHACDIKSTLKYVDCPFSSGKIEALPFDDNAFDVVSAHHTLEHIIHLEKAVKELKRVAKKMIVIVVPKQRYYYYTLDEHVHFFQQKEILTSIIDIPNHECIEVNGDWLYYGYLD